MIANEPVRGRVPPAWFRALSGLERIQALADGRVARPPLHRLLSLRPGHVSPGACTWTMPASEWLTVGPGIVELVGLAETALMTAALTTVSPGRQVRAVALASNHFRPPRPQPGRFIARARVVSASRFFVFASAEIEDAEGRRLSEVSGHFKIETVVPKPPPPPASLPPVEESPPGTPDPLLRPFVDVPGEDPSDQPLWRLLGATVALVERKRLS